MTCGFNIWYATLAFIYCKVMLKKSFVDQIKLFTESKSKYIQYLIVCIQLHIDMKSLDIHIYL